MQKRFGAFILTFMSLFLTCFLTGLPADAAEQSGVEVSVSSGKEEYAAAEDADISFSIRNTNDADIDGVNWKLQLPDGLTAKSGSLSGENLRIRAGESYEGSVSVELAAPDTTEAATEPAATESAPETTAAPGVDAGESTSALCIFGVIAAAAALAWMTRKKSKKLFGILSVFFCAGLIALSAPARIFAADEDSISVEAEKKIRIDGTDYTVKLSVTADAMQEAANPGDFYAWAEYSRENNTITVKWQAQEDASGYKVYDKANTETPLAEVKDKTEYVCPPDETAKAKYVFYVAAESADGKQTVSNDVTVRQNSDGSYTFSDIDSDRDGLDDLDEITRKTDRLNPDTDGDGLKDGYEVNLASTDPLTADTDENGTSDGAEDFDGDGIPTQQEGQYRANPYAGDTDEDGFPDSYEIANGMNPAAADPIVIDDEKVTTVKDYTLTDIEAFNENEEYPLEIFYNDDKFIERINGLYATEKIQNAQDALYSLYHIKSLLGMKDPAAELKFTRTVYSQWSVSYSFNQVYQGVEAEGRTVTITCKKDGKISSVFSGYLCDKHFKKLNLKPTVTKQRLKQIVNSGSDKPVEIYTSDLCIRMNPEAVLVYRVVTSAQKTVWIDAHTGKIVYEKSNFLQYSGHYAVEALDEYSKSRFIDVQVITEDTTDTYYMRYDTYKTGAYRFNDSYVQNAIGSTLPDVESSGGIPAYNRAIDLSDPNHPFTPSRDGWDSQAVSAYCNFFEVRKRYASKGYYGLNGQNGSASIFVRANPIFGVGPITANAAYGPVTIPGGSTYDAVFFTDQCERFATYANDHYVYGHEYGHAVVNHNNAQSGVLSTMFMGTVNEAYADVFGCWVDKKWAARSEPLRDITNPHNSKNPKKIGDKYYDANTADPHLNSTIISYAAYLLNTKYDYSLDELFDVFKVSVGDLSDSMTTFDEIRTSLASAARTIGYSKEKVLHIYDAFEEVGVTRPKSSALIIVTEGSKCIKHATVAISNGDTNKTGLTDDSGMIVFDDLLVGSHEVVVTVLAGPTIRTTVLVLENEQAECLIDMLAASTNYDWDCYDHYDFDQYFGPTLPKHIEINGKNIKMRGYTEVNYKDFLLTHENDDPNSFVHGAGKILSFSIDRDQADWHTLEGGGFLFDVSITKPSESAGDAEDSGAKDGEAKDGEAADSNEIVPGSEGFLTAHCILVTSDGLKIYYLHDVDIALFRNGKLGRIDYIGEQIGDYAYDIGDVKAHHSISINIRKGATETISILDSSNIVVENLEVDKLDGDDYGPITSHDDHWCEQESWFTFSNIVMSNVN